MKGSEGISMCKTKKRKQEFREKALSTSRIGMVNCLTSMCMYIFIAEQNKIPR